MQQTYKRTGQHGTAEDGTRHDAVCPQVRIEPKCVCLVVYDFYIACYSFFYSFVHNFL